MKNYKLKFLTSLSLLGFTMSAYSVDNCTLWAEFNLDAETTMVTMDVPSTSDFKLTGQLIRRPLLSDLKFHWVGYQLYQPKAKLNHQLSKTHEYSVPFAVKLDNKTGEVIKYHFNAKLTQADQNKLIGLHRTLYLSKRPDAITADRYVMVESDELGQYESEYDISNPNWIQRKKLGYLEQSKSNRNTALTQGMMKLETAQVVSDGYKFTPDKCWYSHIEGASETAVKSSDGNMNINVNQVLTLKRNAKPLPVNARLLTLSENPENWQPIALDIVYPKPAPNPLKSKEDFIAALKNIDIVEGDREAILQFLYDNDTYISEIKSLIENQLLDDAVESKLFMYLGKHDSANAQSLLTDVYLQDSLTPNQRFRSLMALKYSQKPMDP